MKMKNTTLHHSLETHRPWRKALALGGRKFVGMTVFRALAFNGGGRVVALCIEAVFYAVDRHYRAWLPLTNIG
jgi:hypothetical protein